MLCWSAEQVQPTPHLRLSLKSLFESFNRKAAAFCHLVESSIALTQSTLSIRQREPPMLQRGAAVQQVWDALQDAGLQPDVLVVWAPVSDNRP